jgi:hypothetical protein
MTTPTITLYPDTLPAKGQAQAAFDTNVDNFLTWQTATNGPELNTFITWTVGVRDNVLATALAGDLPPLTGEALNFIRANATEDGGEFRTPAQVLSDISAAPLADAILTGTVTAPTPTPGNDSDIVATTAFIVAAIAAIDIGALIAALPLGAVGTFATLFEKVASTTPITEGDTRNGSDLEYNGAYWNGALGGSWQGSAAGTSPSGIWQLQGLNTATASVRRGGVWKRIS